MGVEQTSKYYDDFFFENPAFNCHYKDSYYYVLWTQVIVLLKKIKSPKILEIGCGSGQLAHYIQDEGINHYAGFDFSAKAIDIAKKKDPDLHFWVGDARLNEQYKNVDFNTVICLEVLEHVKKDLEILRNIEQSTNLICSVPNFDAPSHVRWFTSESQIKRRYFKLIDISDIIRIGNIYLIYGKRSDFSPNIFQSVLATREQISFKSFFTRMKHRLKNFFKMSGL